MTRISFALFALMAGGALALASSNDLDALMDEAARSDNFVKGPTFDPRKLDRVEWEIPPEDLIISEGLVEVTLEDGVPGPSEEGELARTWKVEVYTVGDGGTRYDALIHPVGTEPYGPRIFAFTSARPTAPRLLAYMSRGDALHVAVEVIDADPSLDSGRIQIRASPQADSAAGGYLGLARGFQVAVLALGAIALLVMCALYFRATSPARRAARA